MLLRDTQKGAGDPCESMAECPTNFLCENEEGTFKGTCKDYRSIIQVGDVCEEDSECSSDDSKYCELEENVQNGKKICKCRLGAVCPTPFINPSPTINTLT